MCNVAMVVHSHKSQTLEGDLRNVEAGIFRASGAKVINVFNDKLTPILAKRYDLFSGKVRTVQAFGASGPSFDPWRSQLDFSGHR